MNTASIEQIEKILACNHVLVLACRDEAGSWAAPVFYASRSLELYFLSSGSSRHSQSIRFDPCFSGAIHGPADGWRSIVGMQLIGQVEQLAGEQARLGRSIYEQRFPFTSASGVDDPALEKALSKANIYRFFVTKAVVIDNTVALGHRLHWSFDEGASA
jgi:uncharacterized protein YhbP (UPF0306 family)